MLRSILLFRLRPHRLVAAVIALLAVSVPAASAAQPPVGLGTATSFGVLSGSAITNTGPSVVHGDLGISPGTAVTGFPPGTVTGASHVTDAVAAQAQSDLTTAYNDAAGRTPALAVAGDLGGLTVVGGVYTAPAMSLTGTVTLNGQNDPSTVFVFQTGSSLTTATSSRVLLINGAQSCNVFWQVGSSATLGTSSTLAGSVLAHTSISMNDSVTIDGRVLARGGAVTMINDTITPSACAAVAPGGGTGGGGTGGGTTGGGTTPGGTGGAGGGGTAATGVGTATLATTSTATTQQIRTYGASRCLRTGFTAVVNGIAIRRVVFSSGGRTLASRTAAPWTALVAPSGSAMRTVTARVTFTDATKPVTLLLRFRSCARAVVRPVAPRPTVRPPAFTG